MKVSTAEAAKRLDLSVPQFLALASTLVTELSEIWPEIDDEYVVMFGKLQGRTFEASDLEWRQAEPATGRRPPSEHGESGRTIPVSKPLPAREKSKLVILDKLERSGRWGKNAVALSTLRNHYCHGVADLEEALQELIAEGLVIFADKGSKKKGPFSLNPARREDVRREVGRIRP